MTDKLPRTMVELRMAFATRANTATVALTEPDDDAKPRSQAFRQGHANGWKAAHLTAQTVMDTPHGSDLDGMREVLELLAENKRRVMALTLANIGPYTRSGTVAALEEAAAVTHAALKACEEAEDPGPPAENNADALPHRPRPSANPEPSGGGEDLSDWSGFPRVPVESVDSFHELALFLGGDVTTFTGDLLRLIAKADPSNLHKLSAAYPREVRAYLLWRASAPVPADTLVKLLEATSMMRGGR